MSNLNKKFLHQLGNIVHAKDKVLLAVSGGLDSMVLLELFNKNKLHFEVAHCNFQLRGKEALADQLLVKNYCQENQLIFHTKNFNIDTNESIQLKARNLRYEWFQEIKQKQELNFIATAHHASDQLETILMNLTKGTGVNGLKGILEKNKDIIRPLLKFTKEELKDYAKLHKVAYREDASNASDKYLRNNFRHHVIPHLLNVNPSLEQHINDFAQRMTEAQSLIEQATSKQKRKIISRQDDITFIDIPALKASKAPKTILKEILKDFDISQSTLLNEIYKLTQRSSGKSINYENKIILKHSNKLLIKWAQNNNNYYQIDNWQDIQLADKKIKICEIPKHKMGQLKPNTIYLCSNSVEFPVTFRKFKDGDYFYPYGMQMKKKKIKKYFIDQKMHQFAKSQTWIMEDAKKRIVWLVGQRMDERFYPKSSSNQSQIIKLQIQ